LGSSSSSSEKKRALELPDPEMPIEQMEQHRKKFAEYLKKKGRSDYFNNAM